MAWLSKLQGMRPWSYINILSIDIALGAVSGCAFFSAVLGTPLLPHAYVSLGLIVWIVYTIDHLLDASRSLNEPSTLRHRFHKQYASLLTAAVVVAATIVTVEAFLVRKPVLFAGIGLALLVIVYLWLQANLKFLKEIAGATLYTMGVFAAPWSLLSRPLLNEEWLLVAIYTVTAYINLLLYALISRESDQRDGHTSTATNLGAQTTESLIRTAFAVAFASIGFLIFCGYFWPAIVLLAMNVIQLAIYLRRTFFALHDRYRLLGDAIFLLPGLTVLAGVIG